MVLAQLPVQIAIARNHPDAGAVKVMGWAGFLAVVPWIPAFIRAFEPTDIVEIRRFPADDRAALGPIDLGHVARARNRAREGAHR